MFNRKQRIERLESWVSHFVEILEEKGQPEAAKAGYQALLEVRKAFPGLEK